MYFTDVTNGLGEALVMTLNERLTCGFTNMHHIVLLSYCGA